MSDLNAGQSRTITALREEIKRLRTRLEIHPEAPAYDGIACRDETIRLQDERIEKLRAYAVTASEALEEIVAASRRAMYERCPDCDNEMKCDERKECQVVPLDRCGEIASAALAKIPTPSATLITEASAFSGAEASGAGGAGTVREAQARIQRDMATTGTARVRDVFAILGDPSKGVTLPASEAMNELARKAVAMRDTRTEAEIISDGVAFVMGPGGDEGTRSRHETCTEPIFRVEPDSGLWFVTFDGCPEPSVQAFADEDRAHALAHCLNTTVAPLMLRHQSGKKLYASPCNVAGPWQASEGDGGGDTLWKCEECMATVWCNRTPVAWGHEKTCRHHPGSVHQVNRDPAIPDATADDGARGFAQWLADLERVMVQDFGFDAATKLDPLAWVDYFIDGLTPAEAIREDFAHAG